MTTNYKILGQALDRLEYTTPANTNTIISKLKVKNTSSPANIDIIIGASATITNEELSSVVTMDQTMVNNNRVAILDVASLNLQGGEYNGETWNDPVFLPGYSFDPNSTTTSWLRVQGSLFSELTLEQFADNIRGKYIDIDGTVYDWYSNPSTFEESFELKTVNGSFLIAGTYWEPVDAVWILVDSYIFQDYVRVQAGTTPFEVGTEVQFLDIPTPNNNQYLVKNKEINFDETIEINGGIALEEGQSLLVNTPNGEDIIIQAYGIEETA